MLNFTLGRARRGAALMAAAVSIFTAACNGDSTGLNGDQADKTPPTIQLSKGGTTADTVLAFQVEVKDNLGIKSIKVSVAGGVSMVFDTTFTSANTDAVVPFTVSVPRSIPRGTPVTVTAFALDGALNKSPTDSLSLTVGNVPAADVRINSPATGSVAVVGKSIVLSLSARSALKIRSIGFRTTGSFPTADSSAF